MTRRNIPEHVLEQVMTKELVFHLERRNFAVVQSIHSSEAGVIAAVRQCGAIADDLEWHVPGPPSLPFAGTWKGLEGLWQLERLVARAIRHERIELKRFLVSGNDVAAILETHGYARGSGRPFRTDVFRFYHLEEGRIVRIHSAFDTAAVAEAVGDTAQQPAHSLLRRA